MSTERTPRRLAAILCADAVGYSRLMGEDDDATVRQMSEFRVLLSDLIERHGGRVVDAPGDNVLAELPSVVDAVSCAVEAQAKVARRNAELTESRRMPFRIGVNLGDVIVEDERIHGEGVNVAARLEALAEPGGICLSGSAHEQVRHQLDLHFQDLGEHELKNIRDPVRVYRIRAPGPTPSGGRRKSSLLRRGVTAAAILLAVLGIAVAFTWPAPLGWFLEQAGALSPPIDPPLPDKPSLVVLPFANLSDDREQEWLADGITEDLITDLSRNPVLFVIASNSAFTYKGRSVDVEAVGRELGVRYVVEGSVRRAGNRIRVTAQLIDATSGFHRWAERYDREMADVFELEAELAGEIMGAVGVQVHAAEAERLRRKPTEDLNAYESYLKGYWHFSEFTRANHERAEALFERAIAIDPEFAAAHAMLGQIYQARWMMAWNRDPALLDLAEASTRRALELDPDQSHALVSLAQAQVRAGDLAAGRAAAERAIQTDPNRPGAYFVLAMIGAFEGRPLAAAEAMHSFLRLNPRTTPSQDGGLAVMQYAVGRTDEALRLWEQALAANPDSAPNAWPLVHIYETRKRRDDALALVALIRSVNPELTAETLVEFGPVLGPERDAHVESLRRAGMP